MLNSRPNLVSAKSSEKDRIHRKLLAGIYTWVHQRNNGKEDTSYEVEEVVERAQYGTDMSYKHPWKWSFIMLIILLHIGLVISIRAAFYAKWQSLLWAFAWYAVAQVGAGLASHRYYSHKSFKATLVLRVLLLFSQTLSGQDSAYRWAVNHYMHHKYSDTDLDPHNSNRGFFFAHIGWVMKKRHPLLRQKLREVDWSELKKDKLLMFQYNYYLPLYFLCGVILPVSVPVYFWNETLLNSYFVTYLLPYGIVLHSTWSINSFAHTFGVKPYDRRVRATESVVTILATLGDGFHNFHHAFPWDYRMTNMPWYSMHAKLIDLFAYMGMAYDLKMVTPRVANSHQKRHGDGTEKWTFVEAVTPFNRKPMDASRTN
ncbi:acyl-CoA desaturase 1 [Megalopta genalis]|uniref:acyl-CoA desaturase 1 n=1 Tax=Megalopta genalis TaxID=115081 RepID=UPI003FD2A26F